MREHETSRPNLFSDKEGTSANSMLLTSINKTKLRSILNSKDSQSAMPERLDGWRTGITEMRGNVEVSITYKLIRLGHIAETFF